MNAYYLIYLTWQIEKRDFLKFILGFNKQCIAIVLLFQLVLSGYFSQAQTYQEAKDLAYSGQREKAREVCRKILSKDFDSDVAVLMARTFAWDGKYDSARVVISSVLKRYPTHWDALDAISDVQYWDEKICRGNQLL